MAWLFTVLVVAGVWALSSLAVLLPALGMAWALVELAGLSLAESCLLVFLNVVVLSFLLQTYLAQRGFSLWMGTFLFSFFSLALVTLEAQVLGGQTDLTLFHACLVVNGANLLTASMVGHSMTGSVPAFLRETFIENILYDEWEPDDAEDYIDHEEVNLPRRKPPRKKRRRS